MHPCAHRSTIYNSQDVESTEVPLNRRMDKEDVIHTQRRRNTSQPLKKRRNLAIGGT